jgi:hypothetical protein
MQSDKLTFKALIGELPAGKVDQVKDLVLTKRSYKEIEDLGALKALEKLNLNNNLLIRANVIPFSPVYIVFSSFLQTIN